MDTIKELLINYRREKRITQKTLADLLNVPPSQLCKWEKGLNVPRKLRQEKIKTILGAADALPPQEVPPAG